MYIHKKVVLSMNEKIEIMFYFQKRSNGVESRQKCTSNAYNFQNHFIKKY